jgi:hypothetical protein
MYVNIPSGNPDRPIEIFWSFVQFLVGGFSESAVLQEAIREEFGDILKVIIPQVRNCAKFLSVSSGLRALCSKATCPNEI